MARKLTITVDDDVYLGLKAKVGARRISRFLNDLARPLVADAEAGPEATEWIDDLVGDVANDGC
jgi:hypothetical protein